MLHRVSLTCSRCAIHADLVGFDMEGCDLNPPVTWVVELARAQGKKVDGANCGTKAGHSNLTTRQCQAFLLAAAVVAVASRLPCVTRNAVVDAR
jgi:hypothetical protein